MPPEKKTTRAVKLESAAGETPAIGKSWFFGIGINEYQNFPSLNNAENDVTEVLAVLQERYELDEFRTLFNQDARRDHIIDGLQELQEQIEENDKLIIYYSGHGHLDRRGRGYWLPHEAEEWRVASYLRNSLIREFVEDIQAWERAQRFDRISGYFQYLNRYPEGRYTKAANLAIERLEQDAGEQAISTTESPKPLTEKQPGRKETLKLPDKKEIPNTFTDPRDGQTYPTVELNGLRWMAQNLNFDAGEGCWLYENDPKNGKKYGRLYTWEAAKKACPPGWRLPTDEEWKRLAQSFGGYYYFEMKKDVGDPKKGYTALMEGGSSGLSAQLGGYRHSNGSFDNLGSYGYYWSATEYGSDDAWLYHFGRFNGKPHRSGYGRAFGRSCRCVQDLSI